MKSCEEYAALLDLYVDGELSPQEMLQVRTHLENCPGCQAYVEDALAIRAAFPEAEDVEVPSGFAESVCAVIQAGTAPRRRRRALWVKTALPMAACCAIVVLLANLPGLGQDREITADTAAVAAQDPAGGVPDVQEEARMETPEEDSEEENAQENLAKTNEANRSTAVVPFAMQKATAGEEPAKSDHQSVEDHSGDSSAEESAGREIMSEETLDPSAPPAPESQLSGEISDAPQAISGDEAEAWVEYGNVVFAAVVYLPEEIVGDALEGFEGKPYSNANLPEEGVIGIGYAMGQEDFGHVLYDVLDYPLGPVLNQDRTTELSCIVVTEDGASVPAE